MFCPRCATENLDDAKFCRACGLDIHLVPQALTGLLPEAAAPGELEKREKKKEKDGRFLEKGLENVFSGVAFLIIFLGGLFYFRGAFMIWIWFIIPALACVGEGLGQLIRWRREQRQLAELFRAPALGEADSYRLPAARPAELPARDTAEMADSPFSVTEATTRHLKARAEAPPREL